MTPRVELLLVVGVAALSAAAACSTDADCSYNGRCSSARDTCVCAAAWRGPSCSTLNLQPARRGAGLNTSGPVSSWGGTVNKGADGKWHMHVAQFVNHCGFNQWATNSRIVHAVADRADGEYRVKDVVWPVFAHNPAVVQSPDDKTWVMTFVANFSVQHLEAVCAPNGSILVNSTATSNPLEQNFLSTAPTLNGPWSPPVRIDGPFDEAVAPFHTGSHKQPNRNSNLIMSLSEDGSMTGLWRRCCSPPPRYAPPGGGGASVIFAVHATDWRNLSTWRPDSTAVFPKLAANGYEDPHIYPDADRAGVFHAIFHNMIGGWHGPEFNNTHVGAHAYSADGGVTWVNTGVAFDVNVEYADGRRRTFIQRERPHVVLGANGQPSYLVSAVTYALEPTLPTCTIVVPIKT